MSDDGFTVSDGAAPPPPPPRKGGGKGGGAGGGRKRKGEGSSSPGRGDNAREQAIEAVMALAPPPVFWRDTAGAAYATIVFDGTTRRYAVRGREFRNLVRLIYGDAYPVPSSKPGGAMRPGAIPDQALNEALGSFEAMALRGEVRKPRVRLCWGESGTVYLDLGGDDWKAVKVTASAWTVVGHADVPLIRPSSMGPLPVPMRQERGAVLAAMVELLNLRPPQEGQPNDDLRMVVFWLLACLYPEGPYPLLALDGEQGSGKTTTSKMLRRLVDPSIADARAMSRDERDLVVAARGSRVLAFDNLSSLSPEMADALCRIATGGGFSGRSLYSNDEEYVLEVCNPVLLNGIPSMMSRPDLADRSLPVTLPPIPDDRRKPEEEVWKAFEAARPAILGMLLDGVVEVLRRLPGLTIARLPRMADFARLCAAAAPAFGWEADDVLATLGRSRKAVEAAVIDGDEFIQALLGMIEGGKRWTGTASELLERLGSQVPLATSKQRSWPANATALSKKLKRIMPVLRRNGLNVVMPTHGGRGGRIIRLEPVPGATPPGGGPPPPPTSWGGDI
ncbi:hypothetical protein IAI18_07575 [Acetobacteraceae bacterium H6797]|nr:hypothetical protein [Acetobacteraceae bacterium H6797]